MQSGTRVILITILILVSTAIIFVGVISEPQSLSGSDDGTSTNMSDSDEPDYLTTPNQTHPGWIPGATSLSNLSDIQIKKYRGLKSTPLNRSVLSETPAIEVPSDLPVSFDWRKKDGDWTTPVRDQGEDCGSCWAHAAVGILESYYKIKNKDPSLPVNLSEQYLVSCDKDDEGCDGGDFETAMPYLVDKPGPDGQVGTVSTPDYPYTGTQGSCQNLQGLTRYKADKWAYVNATVESDNAETSLPAVDELKAAIYLKGPIAVGMYDDDDFDSYDGGIFYSDREYNETNHAVILVGWGIEDGEEFFIGKNSAGSEWGEEGWFKIEVGSNRIGEGAVYLDSEVDETT